MTTIANEISNVIFSVMLPMFRDSVYFFAILEASRSSVESTVESLRPDKSCTNDGAGASRKDSRHSSFVVLRRTGACLPQAGGNDNTKGLCQFT